jgi:hypothetical protein
MMAVPVQILLPDTLAGPLHHGQRADAEGQGVGRTAVMFSLLR